MERLRDLHRRATSRRAPRPPMKLTHPVASTNVLVPMFGVGAALIAVLWGVETWALEAAVPGFDEWLLGALAEQRTPAAVAAARAATHLGDLPVVAAVGLVLVLVARYRAGRWDSAKLVATVVVGALVITAAAKELTARVRPDEALTSTVSLAFPSGHASRAAAVYALLIWLAIRWAKHPVTRHVAVVVGVGMIMATGWSRILLGAHWPTDVVAGWALGLIWFAVVLALTRPVPLASAPPTADRGDAAPAARGSAPPPG